MKVDINLTVGHFAIELIDAVPIFEKFGIGFYPDSQKKLDKACADANASLDKVLEDLKKSEELPRGWLTQAPDFSRETMAALIRYLIHVHHRRTRLLLDKIGEMLTHLVKQGHDPQRLEVVRGIFNKVNGEIRHHMFQEEGTIFPYLVFAEREWEKRGAADQDAPRDNKFLDSIREILFEHRFMDKGFTEIQKLVYLFRSEKNSAELKPLERTLKELADDNERHIYLENEILLKRAAELGLMD